MISVIVPVYNVENYIKRCIESVIAQTYNNWELILVDDGSTDNSGKICEKYSIKDERIKYFRKENGGQSSARNFGLEKASGEYITFCDSDDWLHEQFLEISRFNLINNKADIVTVNYYLYFTEMNYSPIFGTEKGNETCNNYTAMKRLLDNNGTSSSVCARLYKKRIFDNLVFEEGRLFEDAAISYKLFYRANRVTFICKPLMYYFQRDGSSMSRKDKKTRLDEIRAAYERYEFIRREYDNELSRSAAADYVYDLVHVIECFIRDGYDLNELNFFDNYLRKEILKYKYKYNTKLGFRKKIESFFWEKYPQMFIMLVKVYVMITK